MMSHINHKQNKNKRNLSNNYTVKLHNHNKTITKLIVTSCKFQNCKSIQTHVITSHVNEQLTFDAQKFIICKFQNEKKKIVF